MHANKNYMPSSLSFLFENTRSFTKAGIKLAEKTMPSFEAILVEIKDGMERDSDILPILLTNCDGFIHTPHAHSVCGLVGLGKMMTMGVISSAEAYRALCVAGMLYRPEPAQMIRLVLGFYMKQHPWDTAHEYTSWTPLNWEPEDEWVSGPAWLHSLFLKIDLKNPQDVWASALGLGAEEMIICAQLTENEVIDNVFTDGSIFRPSKQKWATDRIFTWPQA